MIRGAQKPAFVTYKRMTRGNTADARTSEVMMLGVVLVWATSFVAVKALFTWISPGNLVLFRFFSAASLFLPILFFTDVKVSMKDFFRLVLLGGLGVTACQLLWIYALQYTSIINVSIIAFSAPLCTITLSPALGLERFRMDRLLAVMGGFIGVYIVVTYGNQAALGGHIKGDLLAIGGSLAWSLYTLLSKPLLYRHSPLKVTAYSIVTGAILFCPLAPFVFNVEEFVRLSLWSWFVLAYTVLFSLVIASAVWYRCMSKTGPAKAINYQYLIPPFVALFAIIFLREELQVSQIVGGLIVFGSIALARKS